MIGSIEGKFLRNLGLNREGVRDLFTKGIENGDDALDVLHQRCKDLFERSALADAECDLVIDVVWELFVDIMKIYDDIQFPQSLREKMVVNRVWLLQFIHFLGSGLIDMDEIVEWKKRMSIEEEAFFWKIFHRKFNLRSNRDFERFPLLIREGILGVVDDWCERNPSDSMAILDVGCGPEAKAIRKLKETYGDRIRGFGIDMEIFDDLAKDVSLKEGDIRSMPFGNNVFDFAYEVAVGGYFKDDSDLKSFISEVLRVLKPGGKLLLADIEPDERLLNILGNSCLILKKRPLLIEKDFL